MSLVWDQIAYLDPDLGQSHCSWCMRWGHGIESCPQLEAKAAAEKVVVGFELLDDKPNPSYRREADQVLKALICVLVSAGFFCGVLVGWMVWK